MNNKITIIDLLNKIANGEEVPKKIKYDGSIYEYIRMWEQYIHEASETPLLKEISAYNYSGLNNEVEILDNEDEDIEEINKMAFVYHVEDEKQNANNDRFKDFINGLIDEVNKLKKIDYSKSKGDE